MSKRRFSSIVIIICAPFLITTALGQEVKLPAEPIVCESGERFEDAECQSKLKGFFTRKGDRLILNLEGEKSRSYVGNSAACDNESADTSKCHVFRILGYYPRIKFCLVESGYYECGDQLFVSRRTGSETLMRGNPPVLSPNARFLLSTDQSDGCDRKYDIAIWSLQSDPPKLEFKYVAREYENWEVARWDTDDHIALKGEFDGKKNYSQEATLVRNGTGWTLQRGRKLYRQK